MNLIAEENKMKKHTMSQKKVSLDKFMRRYNHCILLLTHTMRLMLVLGHIFRGEMSTVRGGTIRDR